MTRLHIPVAVRWSDLDAYQHVNNVEMFRLLEEARITAFWQHPEGQGYEDWPTAILESGPEATSHTFVARQEIEYLRPLAFTRVPVRVEMWIGRLGGASLELCYEIHDGASGHERLGPTSGSAPRAAPSPTRELRRRSCSSTRTPAHRVVSVRPSAPYGSSSPANRSPSAGDSSPHAPSCLS